MPVRTDIKEEPATATVRERLYEEQQGKCNACNLHRIQDHCGCLSAAHLAGLAAEMKLSMTEVYEVATF